MLIVLLSCLCVGIENRSIWVRVCCHTAMHVVSSSVQGCSGASPVESAVEQSAPCIVLRFHLPSGHEVWRSATRQIISDPAPSCVMQAYGCCTGSTSACFAVSVASAVKTGDDSQVALRDLDQVSVVLLLACDTGPCQTGLLSAQPVHVPHRCKPCRCSVSHCDHHLLPLHAMH